MNRDPFPTNIFGICYEKKLVKFWICVVAFVSVSKQVSRVCML